MQTKGWLIVCAVLYILGVVSGGAGWYLFFDKPARDIASRVIAELQRNLESVRTELATALARLRTIECRIGDAQGKITDSITILGGSIETAQGITDRLKRGIAILNVSLGAIEILRDIGAILGIKDSKP